MRRTQIIHNLPLAQMAEWAEVSPTVIRNLVNSGQVTATRHERGGYYFTPPQIAEVLTAVEALQAQEPAV